MIKKSVRKPLFDKSSEIRINKKGKSEKGTGGNKIKKGNINYLKSRYSFHYKKGNWKRAEEYSDYAVNHYNTDLRDWFETKESNKMSKKNIFGFDKPKRLRYG